jgi:hypothetical protein
MSANDDWPSLSEKETGTYADHFVLILYDGSERELAPDEKARLNTKFSGADGDRPYIKTRYEERNGWGRLDGFLLRKRLPPDTPVGRAILLGGQEIPD